MARPRSIPDAVVHDAVLSLLRSKGEKAVTFAAVAEMAGLAASSLAERHGTIAGLISDARAAAWQRLNAQTDLAGSQAPLTPRGAIIFLKALNGPKDLVIYSDHAAALLWRTRVEAALALRLGGGAEARQNAAILFHYWQGQQIWDGIGPRTVRLKDLVKKLTR